MLAYIWSGPITLSPLPRPLSCCLERLGRKLGGWGEEIIVNRSARVKSGNASSHRPQRALPLPIFFHFTPALGSLCRGDGLLPTLFFFCSSFDFLPQFFVHYDISVILNPLRPGIKLQILLLCFLTFLTEVVGRSC